MHAAASAPRRLTRRQLELELSALADPERAKAHAWFFKTGKGQYGEGPVSWYPCSAAAQARPALSIPASRRHRAPAGEHRFTALEILVAMRFPFRSCHIRANDIIARNNP